MSGTERPESVRGETLGSVDNSSSSGDEVFVPPGSPAAHENGPAPGEFIADELLQRVISRAADTNGTGRRKQTRPTVSVIVPALNEEPNLPFVLPMIGLWVDEVILVDGYSTDRTTQVARTLLPGIRIVHQQGSGKGAALRSGFAAASGDII